jgi:N-acetylneuraminate synthase/N,N'-diacetyllegionaminate synthase
LLEGRRVKPIVAGGRRIGPDEPCFVIAEAGVNHNGEVALAKQLIDGAVAAGADAVKFQTWVTELLVTQDAPLAKYQAETSQDASQFELLRRLELSYDVFRDLKEHADRAGILFFSTPDEEQSADFLESLDVALFKIGSAEVTNLPLLKHIAAKRRPTILSTGMSGIGDVERAVAVFRDARNDALVLLHCVTSYPADPRDCNLRAMATMAAAFDVPVGFSDHTLTETVPVAAVALGACVIEKHLTLDRSMSGPDHRASFDVEQFTSMVAAIRAAESALGDGVKRPVASEAGNRNVVRRSIVLARDVAAGEPLAETDLVLRRHGAGLEPEFLSLIVGRRLKKAGKANSAVDFDLLT